MKLPDNTCEHRNPYPVFLDLNNRPCLIVGGGQVALRKTIDLLEAGAKVTVVADSPLPEFTQLSADGALTLDIRRFHPDDVDGAFIIFAATDDDVVNGQVAGAARDRGTLVNTVDNPPLCDFYSSAVMKRGSLQIAVSTNGCAPGLAARIRGDLERMFGDEWAAYLETIREIRQYVLSQEKLTENIKREALLWLGKQEAFELFREAGKKRVWDEVKQIISS